MKKIKKPFPEELRDFIRDATPLVPVAWAIFWLGDIPEAANYNVFWCILFFIATLLVTGMLQALGELVAYNKPKDDRTGDEKEFSLWTQFYRLVFLFLALGLFTIMLKH